MYLKNLLELKFFCDVNTLIIPKTKSHFSERKEPVFAQHFRDFEKIEGSIFGQNKAGEIRLVSRNRINDQEFIKSTMNEDYDLVLVFGGPILSQNWIDYNVNCRMVNIHLGLSPYYKGSGTLFWPFYNNDVCNAGVTFQQLDARLDMGSPIIRFKFKSAEGDYYKLVNILVKKAIDEGVEYILNNLDNEYLIGGYEYETVPITSVYRNSDLTEACIKAVRKRYNNQIELSYDIITC